MLRHSHILKVLLQISETVCAELFLYGCFSFLQKLREELRTLNGEEAEDAEDADDDSQKTFKALLASK